MHCVVSKIAQRLNYNSLLRKVSASRFGAIKSRHLKVSALGSTPLCSMAPVGSAADLSSAIDNYIKSNHVMIFSKTTCPFCQKVKCLFQSLGVQYFSLEFNQLDNGSEMQKAMAAKVGRSSVPQVFIKGGHVGGCDDTMTAFKSGKLQQLLSPPAEDLSSTIDNYVKSNKIMIFSKSTCPYCDRVKDLFDTIGSKYFSLELDQTANGQALQSAMASKVGRSSVPQVFINGEHIGGCDDTMTVYSSGKLIKLLAPVEENYDYDLVVIGGGSGGLAASKEGRN